MRDGIQYDDFHMGDRARRGATYAEQNLQTVIFNRPSDNLGPFSPLMVIAPVEIEIKVISRPPFGIQIEPIEGRLILSRSTHAFDFESSPDPSGLVLFHDAFVGFGCVFVGLGLPAG